MSNTTFGTSALRLYDMGYPVLPAKGKRILLDQWPTRAITRDDVAQWAANGSADANIGCRTGDDSLGVPIVLADVDIYDKDVARTVAASLEDYFGATIERRGMAPKRGLVFVSKGAWPKIATTFRSPDGIKHTVEWLGAGQQFIAYGTHPDTGRPYTYRDDKGLLDVEPWELTQVDVVDVEQWQQMVLPGLVPADWVQVGSTGGGVGGVGQVLAPDERALLNFKPKLDLDWEEVRRAVLILDANMGHDEWAKVLMAIHHQSGGGEEGLALAHEWSAKGESYKAREVETKWRSFKDDPSRGGLVTMATVLKMVGGGGGAAKEVKKNALETWFERIAAADSIESVQRLAEEEISNDRLMDAMARARLIAAIQKRAQELTSVKPNKDIVIRWLSSGVTADRFPDVNEAGLPLHTAANLHSLCKKLGVTIRYNVIKKDDEIMIPGESFSEDNRANTSLAWLMDACHRVEMRTTNLKDFVTLLADRNQFNPVMTWITSKPWDGNSRLKAFYATVKERKADITEPLKNTLLLRWLVSAVKAVADPDGIAAQGVLVFQGAQYGGKTRWVRKLAPDDYKFVKDGMTLDPKNKDLVKIAISHWIIELGELDSTFKKADISALKAFVTLQTDTFRRPYAAAESSYPRRTVFAASVNDEQFLQDPTGNRRYWTIPVERLDHDHDIDMQQLWAEVLVLYQEGEQHYLTEQEMAALNDHNVAFTAPNPIQELISTQLDWSSFDASDCRWMSASDVLRWLGVKNPTRFESTEAGRQISNQVGKVSRKSNGVMLRPVPLKRVALFENLLDQGGEGMTTALSRHVNYDPDAPENF